MSGSKDSAESSRGIKSVEIGYRVLLAIQRGPAPVQLAEVARRTGLSSGAAHNYVASLIRTGLVEQEGRGRYRLGPSAFALSLASFHLLDGYDVLRGEAHMLQTITRANVAVAVWSQGGPVSVFTQRADDSGDIEFRSGLIPMLASAAGELTAAYLPDALTEELIEQELTDAPRLGTARAFIAEARARVLPLGYARFTYRHPPHQALAAPVWTTDDRMAFIISVVLHRAATARQDANNVRALLDSAARASMLIGASGSNGPRSPYRSSTLQG
jgi:DNA-binding IclR family transcriptional regulator